ncbi:hypothetical protein N7537_012279 [Penicillium hordei]|uniref:Uncharacterized protein n=1 Tax=Penicillium hordei TaxID=40994 RepID=A0AAD6DNG2_9EURO|nr:uncharacterized protein N7537_012279 [Penicillium hordei]KAJ5589601.1 hypothetical protein N7537_012279 [Penicillium hordei]
MDWEDIDKKKIPQSERQPTIRQSRKPIMQAINFMDVCDVSAQRQTSLRHFCGWIESGSGSSERLTGYSIRGRLKEQRWPFCGVLRGIRKPKPETKSGQ